MALDSSESAQTGAVARSTGNGRFETRISAGGARFLADEPVEVGGGGNGPTPYELLSAALAACTSMTLRLYAERKGWILPPFQVEVAHRLVPGPPPNDRFDRRIAFDGPIDPEQEAKLLDIADKCPVHRSLSRGFAVSTHVGPPDEHPSGEPAAEHERQMEQACAD